MKRILITGATGNIGREAIRFLYQIGTQNRVVAGVRNIECDRQKFANYPQLDFVEFDFKKPDSGEIKRKANEAKGAVEITAEKKGSLKSVAAGNSGVNIPTEIAFHLPSGPELPPDDDNDDI